MKTQHFQIFLSILKRSGARNLKTQAALSSTPKFKINQYAKYTFNNDFKNNILIK
jgi:hypothetical protein